MATLTFQHALRLSRPLHCPRTLAFPPMSWTSIPSSISLNWKRAYADASSADASSPAASSPAPSSTASSTAATLEPPLDISSSERPIFDKLARGLRPTKLRVHDISDGCGSMFSLHVIAEQFRDLPVIKQHRLVKDVLGDEFRRWHGVQLRTEAPELPTDLPTR